MSSRGPVWRVKIAWLPASQGGRSSGRPVGAIYYATIVLRAGLPVPQASEHVSAGFRLASDGAADTTGGEMWVLVRESSTVEVVGGMEFRIMEGPRQVAVGTVLGEMEIEPA